jgi:hypothetical protein
MKRLALVMAFVALTMACVNPPEHKYCLRYPNGTRETIRAGGAEVARSGGLLSGGAGGCIEFWRWNGRGGGTVFRADCGASYVTGACPEEQR